MKKILLIILSVYCTLFSLSAVAQHPSEVQFQILEDPALEGKFYPSLALWNSNHEDPSDLFYSFYLIAPKKGDVIRITVEETKLNEETIIQRTVNKAGEIEIEPIIKWKYDQLAKLAQGGTVTMTCILEINGKEIDRYNHIVRYRPVNECVYGLYNNDEWTDISEMFALYVNEDYPEIDKILEEILAVDPKRSFLDYQGSMDDFFNQVFWIWEYFSKKGTRYSNVVNTSNVSEQTASQYVRFIDQVLGNNQANCVDGSVMLASIYRKIGLNAYLVILPAHCMLAIECPYEVQINEQGDMFEGGVLLLETTLMGSVATAEESFYEAYNLYDENGINNLIENEDYIFVNIEAARANGILPISRPMRGGSK